MPTRTERPQIPEELQHMPNAATVTPFEEGLRALSAGRTNEALDWFEKAVAEEKTSVAVSYLAYCRAREKGAIKEAVALCMDALKDEPKNTEIYLNLGRIYLLSGHKRSALRAFELGLRYGKNADIEAEFKRIGRRKSPPIPFLDRSNPINKILGKILRKLGMR